MDIAQLKDKLEIFGKNVSKLEGEFNYIREEYNKNLTIITELEKNILLSQKAVELLIMVQKVTRDQVKEKFENLVSWALASVFEKPSKFILEFGTRGNLGELDFKIIPYGLKEPIYPTSGGELNVISLILRIIVMELMKIKGFILMDECLSFVNGKDNVDRLNGFIEQIQEKFKRQIIHITDMSNFKEGLNYNLIEIK